MTAPNWNVAIVDGQPEVVINAAAVAALVKISPLGREQALANLRKLMAPDVYALVEKEL